ncbi:carbamoyltransferase HypF [Pseudonocardia eucalypti]|uniref:Carbamoyltransferase n=1 Tax=Pseudonocardia eucalypti TaxID=648755 RepID=A0ABP9QLQ5_9PSEU|nr:hydrogenase maturation protein HypF [Pseudonocardia eucalypti]
MTHTVLARRRIRVGGIVQGVGFRPFVYALAREFGLAGFVRNDESGVLIEVEGDPAALSGFTASVPTRAPALAVVAEVRVDDLPPTAEPGFHILASAAGGRRGALISPDTATCADCLAELADPADRRYRYPFVNCTNCGPRLTIVTGVPYDRRYTTMAGFPMCRECATEYHDPADRRFHAQPVCCPACGPTLRCTDPAGTSLEPAGDPLAAAVAALRAGAVLAVKGIGGYHLAALARDERAVAALRARKHREDKPFALLAADLAAARRLVEVDGTAAAELTSRRAPIVLLPRRPDAPVAPSVAPGNRYLGVLLPYTPLHHLLAADLAEPLVLTSGNVSDEPIAYRDGEAAERLGGIADGLLTHDRPIHTRADDSVLRVTGGRVLPIRRSRGYAPEPLPLATPARRPVLGCGAELKSTFCLAEGGRAFLSHHIGDLENAETLRSFTEGIAHYRTLFDITPEVVAHDLHPEYLSTKYALELPGVRLVGVQHHHAHLAACLADNRATGPVIGLACDGLGYGTDGTLWGGELMEVSITGFRRLAHLETVPLPGGATAIRQPWRMAAAWLRAAHPDGELADLAVVRRQGARWTQVERLLGSDLPVPLTSSVGRLFDAVAALAGVRDEVNYEGQAAVELEQAVDPEVRDGYPMRMTDAVLYGADLVRGAVRDLRAGRPAGTIAARFHRGLAAGLAEAAAGACARTGLDTVALSGGVFQNVTLLHGLRDRLDGYGLRVLTHSRVPPNDAGISLGQVTVAAALDRA